MKKPFYKRPLFWVLIVILSPVIYFINAFIGNPVSHLLVTISAKSYLAENYSDTDFEIDDIGYNFKTGWYYAQISSPTSIDSHFDLNFNMLGTLERDTYTDSVLNKWNTDTRITHEYYKLVQEVFDDGEDYPYKDSNISGQLEIASPELIDEGYAPQYAILRENLIIDKEYDIPELGRQAGTLRVWGEYEDLTVETAAQIMLKTRSIMDKAGVTFRGMELSLSTPYKEDEEREEILIRYFLYEDIYEEGLEERIKANWEETMAYYEKQEAEKQKELDADLNKISGEH